MSLFGKDNPNWKGGRTITKHGYVLIRVGKDHPLSDCRGYAYEHRLKAWEAGHNITGKHVHHETENKQDNDPSHLKPLTPAWHGVQHRKRTDLRMPDEENPELKCACGCGETFPKYDAAGRPRRYLPSHNAKVTSIKTTQDAIISFATGRPSFKTSEAISSLGLSKTAVKVCLSKLGRKGILDHLEIGIWRLS